MKVLKPIFYCLLGAVLTFVCMYFTNNQSVEDEKIKNEKVIDKDVPIIELQVSSRDVSVGDTVTYSIISKVESGNIEAFENNRIFYYDFTGDGIWDFMTKNDTVTYTFLESYENGVSPKVAVEFRGKLGQADGNTIFVKQKLKPILLYNSIGNTVIFRDLSMGKSQEREICFEKSECEAGNKRFKKTHIVPINPGELEGNSETIISKNDGFIRKYDNYGNHKVTISLKDVYGEDAEAEYDLETKDDKENGLIAPGINMITIPETTFNNTNPEIFLSKVMNNALLMYINNDTGEETCYVDTDIATDSDGDRITDNDKDVLCNKMAKIVYDPGYQAIGRIYFMNNGELTFKNFYVTFEGSVLELDEEKRGLYKDISTLINGIEDLSVENTDLKTTLNRLRNNLNNRAEISTLLITINEQLYEGGIMISIKEKELLDSILSRLSDEYTIVLVGMDEYEKNKREIIALLPPQQSLKSTIEKMFNEFEENLFMYNQKERTKELEKIWNVIIKDGKKNKWMSAESDFTPYFCNIFDYYSIADYADKC